MESLFIERFQEIIARDLEIFCLEFSPAQLLQFSAYYQLVLKWNDLLHLTTLISPEDFASRNILESSFAALHIHPHIKKVIDIGSGAGLPGIPIAILRPDISVSLVEVNKKKALFLKEAIDRLQIKNLKVLNQRFEEVKAITPDFCLTSRALDKFIRHLPNLMKVAASGGQMLLFGNEKMLDFIRSDYCFDWILTSYVIPCSDNRLLISLSRST